MSPQNIEQVAEIIKKNLAPIAEKVGAGFEIFKLQAKISAVQEFSIFIVLCIAILTGAIKIFKSNVDKDEIAVKYVLGWTILFFGTILFLYSLFNFIGTFINPDYYAIKLILNLK